MLQFLTRPERISVSEHAVKHRNSTLTSVVLRRPVRKVGESSVDALSDALLGRQVAGLAVTPMGLLHLKRSGHNRVCHASMNKRRLLTSSIC